MMRFNKDDFIDHVDSCEDCQSKNDKGQLECYIFSLEDDYDMHE